MAACSAFTLEEYMREKLSLLEEMLCIAQTQLESIEQDRPDELLRALRKRDRIIRRIDSLDASFRKFNSRAEGYDTGNDEIRRVAQRILAIDRQCEEKGGQKMTEYKTDIKSFAQSAKQLGAYAHPFQSSQGIFFDAKK